MVKIVDHDERRSAIAEAAIAVIAEVGLEQAKLRLIAARAGVTTGAVAHYFKDKDALLEATLLLVGRCIFNNEDETQLLSFADVLPISDLSRRNWRVWLTFCGHASYSEKLRMIYKRFYIDIEQAVAKDLKISDKERAKEVAASIIAAVDGVGLCATVQPELWPPARQKARLAELLKPFFK